MFNTFIIYLNPGNIFSMQIWIKCNYSHFKISTVISGDIFLFHIIIGARRENNLGKQAGNTPPYITFSAAIILTDN
jgi:hypothetical protein